MYDSSGMVVSSEERADTLAEYLESIQWAVRPATVTDEPPIFDDLPVRRGPVTMLELKEAVHAFKLGKATGPDLHPVEFWRAVLGDASCEEGASWLLLLCNMAWDGHDVPESWHLARVAAIYKKGDPGDCGNYSQFVYSMQPIRFPQ